MSIRIEFMAIAFILIIGESANSKQISKISLIKEYLDQEGKTFYADMLFNFGGKK